MRNCGKNLGFAGQAGHPNDYGGGDYGAIAMQFSFTVQAIFDGKSRQSGH